MEWCKGGSGSRWSNPWEVVWGWTVRSQAHVNCWCQIRHGKSIFYNNREEGYVGLESGSFIHSRVRIYGKF